MVHNYVLKLIVGPIFIGMYMYLYKGGVHLERF